MRHQLVMAALGAACALAPQDIGAQAYPSKPIRFIVPFPPGGGNDIVGRVIAQGLAEALNQNVVVDNRGGAGGTIGTRIAAQAPPDGHTLLINNISLAVNATLIPNLPYDTLKDLAPVSVIGRQPNIVVVHPSLKAASLSELLDLARTRRVTYGSGGVGTASHLATELLQLQTATRMSHIPYKGLGPALTDLMGGRVDMIISTLASALPQIKSRRLRPLAVTTAMRTGFFPDLPTMIEAGVRDYDFTTWYALVVPAATPKPVLDRINRELGRIAQSRGVHELFAAQGLETAHTSPAAARAYLAAEIAKWAGVIKSAGVRND